MSHFVTSQEYRDLFDIAAEPVVFEWKIFPGHTMLLLQEHQTMMENEIKVHPRDFKGRIIFMSRYNDIDWTQKNNEDICRQNASCVTA